MASISQREWSLQYEITKKRIQAQRNSGKGALAPAEYKQVAGTVTSLESQLKVMGNAPLQYEIVASEIARRQVLVQYLQRQLSTIAVSTGSTAPTAAGSSGRKVESMSITGSGVQNPMTKDGLILRQKDIVRQQDEMILNIESGVDRLHNKARAIGDEAKLHDRLLDDLDSHVDVTTQALIAEAAHAEKIKDSGKVCSMYICVAVEIIILFIFVMLIVVG